MASVMHEVPTMDKLLKIAKTIYFLGAILVAFFFTWALTWTLDRDAPFEVYQYRVNTPKVGEILEINAKVRRDLNRHCSVKFTRIMYDVDGRRFWESDETTMSAPALEEMNAKMKGGLKLL